MKILQVVPLLGFGGVEKMVTNYFDHIDHNEIMFDFISHSDHPEDYHKKLIDSGCKIYYLKTIGELGFSGYKKQIQQNIDIKSYDIVHVHVGHLTGVYAKVFRDLGAKKIICHAHTTKCVNYKHSLVMPVLRYMANKYSDRRLACGIEAGKYCFGKGNFTLIPNGLDYKEFNDVSDEKINSLKNEFCISDNDLVVGHVGHFDVPKNHKFIVDIIKQCVSENKNIKFILVGEGPLKKNIEESVRNNGSSDNVIFTGARTDVNALMHIFNIFILPSLHEGLPLVGIEAQAAGTKCLFSDTIDKTVDLGAGLAIFLPIDKGARLWTDKLFESVPTKADAGLILERLVKTDYEINQAAAKLVEFYRKTVEE